MGNVRKTGHLVDIGEDARRQYIDAQSTFTAWEDAALAAAEVRGGMYWKRQGSGEYLIRTRLDNSQKSLGPRSPETEAMYLKFMSRKTAAEDRQKALAAELDRHQRMNRALHVGRAPRILVDILNMLQRASLAEHFIVIGTHALYGYEAAAGVRIGSPQALATQDVDLLWDTRKRVSFVAQMELQDTSMLELLQKVDPTFQLRQDQLYTAVNDKGFEVDIVRQEATKGGDPHPLRMSSKEDDFWATQAERASVLLGGPQLSVVIASSSGHMARMRTVAPGAFSEFKRWMAARADRDPMKRARDRLQAEIVEEMVAEYLPHLAPARANKDIPTP